MSGWGWCSRISWAPRLICCKFVVKWLHIARLFYNKSVCAKQKKTFLDPSFFRLGDEKCARNLVYAQAKIPFQNKMSVYEWKVIQIEKELVALIIDSTVKRIGQKRTSENSCYQMTSHAWLDCLLLEIPILKDGQQKKNSPVTLKQAVKLMWYLFRSLKC